MAETKKLQRYTWFIDQVKRNRHPNARKLAEAMKVSPGQAQHDIEFLRDDLHAPLHFVHDPDPDRCGYELKPGSRSFELPTVWIEEQELLVLAIAKELIRDPDSEEILSEFFGKVLPINSTTDLKKIEQFISWKGMGFYHQKEGVLNMLISALLQSRKADIHFCPVFAAAAKPGWITISPLHLLHYKTNWYVLARYGKKLRTFSLSRIDEVRVGDETHGEKLSAEAIRKKITAGFGIFVTDEDNPIVLVRLRFSADIAAFVSTIVFHPKQKAVPLGDGRLEVSFPSTINRELIGEVLRFVDEVEIVEPAELEEKVCRIIEAAMRKRLP